MVEGYLQLKRKCAADARYVNGRVAVRHQPLDDRDSAGPDLVRVAKKVRGKEQRGAGSDDLVPRHAEHDGKRRRRRGVGLAYQTLDVAGQPESMPFRYKLCGPHAERWIACRIDPSGDPDVQPPVKKANPEP